MTPERIAELKESLERFAIAEAARQYSRDFSDMYEGTDADSDEADILSAWGIL